MGTANCKTTNLLNASSLQIPDAARKPVPWLPATGSATVPDEHLETALADLADRIAPLFARAEPRAQTLHYITGLLNRGGRMNSWQLARRAGDRSPWRMQRLLTRARWDSDAVMHVVRNRLSETLGHPDAVLVLSGNDTLKKGAETVGVTRQYTEITHRVENCQSSVLTAYVSRCGAAIIDRELHLPTAWTDDPERCRKAGVPESRWEQRSKCDLARTMVRRAVAESVPFRWISGGPMYGHSDGLLHWLEKNRICYAFAVSPRRVTSAVTTLIGAGSLSTVVHPHGRRPSSARPAFSSEWTRITLPSDGGPAAPGWIRSLLIRRPAGPDQPECYLTHAPRTTSISSMIAATHARRSCQRCLDVARGYGLDRHEVRTWTAWYRHTTLCLAALTVHTLATADPLASQPEPQAAAS